MFKHGPIALVEEGKKTIGVVFILNDEHFSANMSTLKQLQSNQAYTIVITDCKDMIDNDLADYFISIPSCGYLTAVLAVIPMQLLTLYIGNKRGVNIDQPRNLAKTITVK